MKAFDYLFSEISQILVTYFLGNKRWIICKKLLPVSETHTRKKRKYRLERAFSKDKVLRANEKGQYFQGVCVCVSGGGGGGHPNKLTGWRVFSMLVCLLVVCFIMFLIMFLVSHYSLKSAAPLTVLLIFLNLFRRILIRKRVQNCFHS